MMADEARSSLFPFVSDSEWQSPSGRNISVVACNPTQVVAAVGCDIYCLEILAGNLVQSRLVRIQEVYSRCLQHLLVL